jgi:alkanesulfonate monooxygenase SsuD/methylene tetrahydromethanopterin reductase-like flavin-dependent oxidoreductase (luciferase family)
VSTKDLHRLPVAVALDGAGWHPAAWREPNARPRELFSAQYWVDLVRESEWGLLDFVTIEDSMAIQSSQHGILDQRTDQVRGRLDAVLTAARVAPTTSSIGIVPVVNTTHTEPFHVSKSIATLDFVSQGRAGLQARVSASGLEARQFGRRFIADPTLTARTTSPEVDSITDLFDEAADFIEVARRLWDSWEDDAEIRDVVTGRFIDRDKLHYIDFEGQWFSVKGPSITPRPPQGQPVVSVLAHFPLAYELAARSADLVFTTPMDAATARSIVHTLRGHEVGVARAGEPLRIFADVVVFLDDDPAKAAARKDRLDERLTRPFRSDAFVFVGTPDELAALMTEWQSVGIEGFRLRPGALPHDLEAITHELVGLLQDRSAFRPYYEETTLRDRLGLSRPDSRYVLAHANPSDGGPQQ